MSAQVEIVINAQDNASGVLGNFGSILTGIESAINLVGQAFDLAGGVITPFIDSASESEQAVARLEGVLRATGGAVGLTSDELQSMADGLQNVTRFSDETILNGEAILLTFRNLGGEMFERTVPAMLDMAEIFGSVDSAAMQLGKALNDPLTGMGALSRAGITFSEEQRTMIRNFMEMGDVASAQNIILSEVELQVGGLAIAMGQTFAGQMDIFNNKLDTLRETIGGAMLPALTDLVGAFGNFVASPAVIQFIDDLALSISNFIEPYSQLIQVVFSRIENGSDPFTALLSTLENYNGSTGISGFVDTLLNVIDTVRTFIDTGQSEGWDVAIGNLFEGFNIAGTIQGWIDNLIVVISGANWGPIGDTISTVLSGSVRVALEGLDAVVNEVDFGPLGTSLRNALGEAVRGAFDGTDLSYNFQQWISDLGNPYYWRGIGENIVDGLLSGFELGPGFREIGQNMKNGLMSGFELGELGNDFVAGFQTVIARIKTFLGIASDSTVFIGIARNMVGGLMTGWDINIGNFIETIEDSIAGIIDLFPDWLQSALVADASGLGTAGGGTSGGTTGGGSGTGGGAFDGAQTVNINNYGPVYYVGAGEPGAYYDCPSPHPLVAGSGNQLVTTGF